MAKKKYQSKRQNADARLESEGLTRIAGRVVPINKEKKTSVKAESVEATNNATASTVVPPKAKTKAKAKPSKKSVKQKTTSKEKIRRTVSIATVLALVATIFVGALASGTANQPQVTEQPVTDVVTTPVQVSDTLEVTTPSD